MPGKVFIENHLDNYLNNLAKDNKRVYIPGVIIGQVSRALHLVFFRKCIFNTHLKLLIHVLIR